MPQGKHLSQIEQQRIVDLSGLGSTQIEIANKLGRSKSVISKFLKNGAENYGTKARSGRPKKISEKSKRLALREVSKNGTSSDKVVKILNLNCCSRLVRYWLNDSANYKYCKIKFEPPLKEHHKTARLKFAENYIQKTDIWHHVIFSDEKKFNLDGPDGFKYYWHDIRKDRRILSKRTAGGGSVMIWAAFKGTMKSEIAFINGRINACDYQKLLENYLLPFVTCAEDENFIFQQDNAPIHNAFSTKRWCSEFGIPVMNWPALSPDLNPIENLWGILARDVYDVNKPQIQTVDELKERILRSWNEIPVQTLTSLMESMPRRLFEVIRTNGAKTKY